MAASPPQLCCNPTTNNKKEEREEEEEKYEKQLEMIRMLPKGLGWRGEEIVLYHGCWLSPNGALKAALLVQNQFKARPTDIFL